MEYIVGLPMNPRRHDSIFFVVDTLTKSAHFIQMKNTYQALEIVKFFIKKVMRLHGVPRNIIFDRELVFT